MFGDIEEQWDNLTRINESYSMTNCQDGQGPRGEVIQGLCPDPLPPGGQIEYFFRNRSAAYIAVVFPGAGYIQEIGSNEFAKSKVTLGGSVLLPLSAIVLPPDRE
jgi:hypothetical protein